MSFSEERREDEFHRAVARFISRIESPIRIISTNYNLILAAIEEFNRSTSGASGLAPKLQANKADQVLAAVLVNGGKSGRAAISQSLEAWNDGRIDWLSDTLRYLLKDKNQKPILKKDGEDIYEVTDYYGALRRLAKSPARTWVIENTGAEEATKIVAEVIEEYLEDHKTFHVREFLEKGRLDFGDINKLIEKTMPSAIIKLEQNGVVKTATGHDGILVGREQPVAYVTLLNSIQK